MARKRTATDQERALWETTMRDVRRIRAARPRSEPPPEIRAPSLSPETAPVALVADMPKPALPRPGGADRVTLERLKRGQVTIEGRIDLHGMTQAEAFGVLLGFIDSAQRSGRRKLLVITGKGALAEGGGVLRRSVPKWLAAAPIAHRILAVAPAHPRHGGDGALYVLLRKAKP